MENVIDAVVGFMFSHDKTRVALIRKNRPTSQVGKLNGVGGKLEPGEGALTAMVREFVEETGVQTRPEEWMHFITLNTPKWKLWYFMAFGDIDKLTSMTDETVEIIDVQALQSTTSMPNVKWMVPLCLDSRQYAFPFELTEV